MSKLAKSVLLIICACLGMAILPLQSRAQYVDVVIRIDPATASANISGKWASGTALRRSLSFLPSGIGAPDLGRRISNVAMNDLAGRPISFRRFNSAEYMAEADFTSFSYQVDLRPSADPRSAAHTSWIGTEAGLIFPEDLLPLPAAGESKGAVLTFVPVHGWPLFSMEEAGPSGVYRIGNIERSVFVVGKDIRRPQNLIGTDVPAVVISGQWLFDDADAASMTAEVHREYARVFGGALGTGALVILLPMPQPGVQKGTWEAEARGSTVVITSSDMHFKAPSLQRLHEQLRHEMFHLWLPNRVNLTGRYDWFYEGLALYQSLRSGVALNRIRFDDLLDTLSRAHSIDRSQTRRRSLIEMSEQRWIGADTELYARGMVVAFLCDLVLLERSNGRRSIETLLAQLYSGHRYPDAAADANTSVLKLFEADPGLASLATDHIRGAKPIEWTGIIDAAGLENDPGTSRTGLRIKAKLTGKQKALLDKLGYNNWRKLTRK